MLDRSTSAGADVLQWSYHGGASQCWRLVAVDDGSDGGGSDDGDGSDDGFGWWW